MLQGVKSTYETDLIRPIIDFTAKLAGKKYVYDDSEDNVSMRVIADHARARPFLIADGIFPGRDTRGYVLRKIMRRAIWHGNKLGFKDVFFAKVTEFRRRSVRRGISRTARDPQRHRRVVTTEGKLHLDGRRRSECARRRDEEDQRQGHFRRRRLQAL